MRLKSGQSVHLGLADMNSDGASPPAVPLIFSDRVGGVYKSNGISYGTELLMLQSLDPVGATKVGQAATLGPVVVSGTPELLVNGDFSSDISGWSTAFGTGGPPTFSWDAGAMKCTTSGSTQSRAEQFPPFITGESYFLSADLTRNGADVSCNVVSEATYAFPATLGLSQLVNATASKSGVVTAPLSRCRVGMRQNVAGGTDWHFDNASLKLCRPVNAGWSRKHRWTVSAVAKVAPTNTEWLFCLTNNPTTAGNNYEYLAVYRRQSDGHIIVEHHSQTGFQGSPQNFFSVDIGAVADGATFTVELKVANRCTATLNGGIPVVLPAAQPVNYPLICIGKAFYGGTTAWTGTINSYLIDNPTIADTGFNILGYGHSLIYGNQASPIMGLVGNSWAPRLVRDSLAGAAWYNNMGRPGATSTQLRNGIVDQSDATYFDYFDRQPFATDPRTVLVLWCCENDGDTAGIQNTRDIIAKWKAINGPSAKFIVVEPMYWADLHNQTQADAVTAQYRIDWGSNSFDIKGSICAPTLGGLSCQGLDDAGIAIVSQQPSDQTDFAALIAPASLRNSFTDAIHPSNNGSIAYEKAFYRKLLALGYN